MFLSHRQVPWVISQPPGQTQSTTLQDHHSLGPPCPTLPSKATSLSPIFLTIPAQSQVPTLARQAHRLRLPSHTALQRHRHRSSSASHLLLQVYRNFQRTSNWTTVRQPPPRLPPLPRHSILQLFRPLLQVLQLLQSNILQPALHHLLLVPSVRPHPPPSPSPSRLSCLQICWHPSQTLRCQVQTSLLPRCLHTLKSSLAARPHRHPQANLARQTRLHPSLPSSRFLQHPWQLLQTLRQLLRIGLQPCQGHSDNPACNRQNQQFPFSNQQFPFSDLSSLSPLTSGQ